MSIIPIHPNEQDQRTINMVIRELQQGRDNAAGTVTLRANQATTVVPAVNVMAGTSIQLTPCTVNAAAALATTYVPIATVVAGSFTINHANNAQVDKSFFWNARG